MAKAVGSHNKKPCKHRITANDYMYVMNNFFGGKRWRIMYATEIMGVSYPTFHKWGTQYFEANGDLRKCPFIIQESIPEYENNLKKGIQPTPPGGIEPPDEIIKSARQKNISGLHEEEPKEKPLPPIIRPVRSTRTESELPKLRRI